MQTSASCPPACVLSLQHVAASYVYTRRGIVTSVYQPSTVSPSFPTVLGLKYCFTSGGFKFLIFILQTLAECKQRPAFSRLLKLYEEKAVCCGRTIENYLTAPMHRVSSQETVQHFPTLSNASNPLIPAARNIQHSL